MFWSEIFERGIAALALALAAARRLSNLRKRANKIAGSLQMHVSQVREWIGKKCEKFYKSSAKYIYIYADAYFTEREYFVYVAASHKPAPFFISIRIYRFKIIFEICHREISDFTQPISSLFFFKIRISPEDQVSNWNSSWDTILKRDFSLHIS